MCDFKKKVMIYGKSKQEFFMLIDETKSLHIPK